MPVDLSPAGLPSAYPAHGPRFWPWLLGWLLCCGLGAAVVLLLWPTGTPARGARFWLCLFGIPNAVFFAALAIARTIYEADYLHALFRNRHRAAWLRGRILTAQRPLQVLGAGYCLPLDGKPLGEVLAGKTSLLEARVPRSGTGRVLHSRFADDDPMLGEDPDAPGLFDTDLPDGDDAEHVEAFAPIDAPDPRAPVPPAVRMIAQALAPLVESLVALTQYGAKYAPAVRVLSAPEMADVRVDQVRQALQRNGLPDLECFAVPATDGLMVADAWLDAGEQRPLLVVAAEWHDTPSPGSTEGAVAVLLGPGMFQLPKPVSVLGLLHRPVTDELDGLDAVLQNGVLWGKSDVTSVATAWISGLDGSHDTKLLAALRAAGLAGIAKQEAQRRPDALIGQAGAAGGWLSVAAALEAAAGTQLILHAPLLTTIAQAAILHVNDRMNHKEPDDERSQ
ncbi:hypothetical protein [Burkholderia glumae]|uniref:Uncharacterized protein n=1 Tax=Burkholderia glumae TaxID=337 RepID=A0AAP9XYD6_BURGL|nr:hypothetical protein [Burkholderia glumae]ACR31040.1 Hypothetical protein bglu_2g05990 [Burkholderia glumae BGR1]AJY63798.1 hypothetical protein KS03_5316 [Burkholderia glumae LMG 2196 = ATCC 33617]KHJ62461.1 hypothetical protein NCPPB3923_13380 [Burkholderia glumae]MCM2483636.1 hypothetical protein [Burkholderia glumae]MCM2509330.1 hypothetical protein [Burkholderia glumae]